MNARHLVLPLLASTLVAACERAPAPPPRQVTAIEGQQLTLTKVEQRDQVCMVNDQFMGRPQIPVEVEGRTYFGCCAMCKTRLEQEHAARIAIDPVSGREVDKSLAVLAQDSAGKIFYFESEANLASYSAGTK